MRGRSGCSRKMRSKRWTISLTASKRIPNSRASILLAVRWLDSLPHQPPMRLLEEIVSVSPGEQAVALRRAKPEDFYFQGHFPQDPIVPAVILVEMVAQAGGLAAGSASTGEASTTTYISAWPRLACSSFPLLRDREPYWKHPRGSSVTAAVSTRSKALSPLMESSWRPGASHSLAKALPLPQFPPATLGGRWEQRRDRVCAPEDNAS